MSDQPEALFLADVIENDPQSKAHHDAAAACLRRLHALAMDQQGEIYGLTFARETERKIHGLVKAECDALRAALKFIADHDLSGADLTVAGHIAHGLIGKARAALKEAK